MCIRAFCFVGSSHVHVEVTAAAATEIGLVKPAAEEGSNIDNAKKEKPTIKALSTQRRQ